MRFASPSTLAATPDHAEALVWHGGGLVFLAGQAFQRGDTATGMERFGKGLGEMNKAVELAPDRVGVRVPRGATLLEQPERAWASLVDSHGVLERFPNASARLS